MTARKVWSNVGDFFDAQNRRVRKQYPNGDLDGYLWDTNKELLMETSPTVTGQPARTMDEYVWLAGRPVLSIRSLYQAGQVWQRAETDWATSCPRRGVAGTCQPVGLITDVIGKPIASIDSQRRLAGALEYDPFGLVNRSTHWGEVAPHPASGCSWTTTWMSETGCVGGRTMAACES